MAITSHIYSIYLQRTITELPLIILPASCHCSSIFRMSNEASTLSVQVSLPNTVNKSHIHSCHEYRTPLAGCFSLQRISWEMRYERHFLLGCKQQMKDVTFTCRHASLFNSLCGHVADELLKTQNVLFCRVVETCEQAFNLSFGILPEGCHLQWKAVQRVQLGEKIK